MAKNFATLEYKTQEEVLTVIKHLTAILSTTGMQILELISPSHLLAQLRSPPKSSSRTTQETQNHEEPLRNPDEAIDANVCDNKHGYASQSSPQVPVFLI
jgi:cohesin loading factor subunit SCC2